MTAMSLEEAAVVFHKANPHVYALFKRFALEVMAKGYKKFSVAAVWERMRWEAMFSVNHTDPFKINNNHKAYYARWFMAESPDYAKFFNIRVLGCSRHWVPGDDDD
jgi:hypothetical protein